MPAALIALPEQPHTPTARELRLKEKVDAAISAWNDAQRTHIDAHTWREHLEDLHSELFCAQDIIKDYWKRRAQIAERALRDTLGEDLTDEQFAHVLKTLKADDRRNPRLLTANEVKLIADYRAMDADARNAVRTVFDRFATKWELGEFRRNHGGMSDNEPPERTPVTVQIQPVASSRNVGKPSGRCVTLQLVAHRRPHTSDRSA